MQSSNQQDQQKKTVSGQVPLNSAVTPPRVNSEKATTTATTNPENEKLKLKEQFQAYVKNATEGCKREKCWNPICAKNASIPKRTKEQIAAEGVRLVSTKEILKLQLCTTQEFPHSLQGAEVRALIEEARAKTGTGAQRLIARTKEVFENELASLNFMKEYNLADPATKTDPNVDLGALDAFYKAVLDPSLSLPPAGENMEIEADNSLDSPLRTAFEDTVVRLVHSLRVSAFQRREEGLRALFVVLLYPELFASMDEDRFSVLMRPYLEQIFRLDKDSREIFVTWLCTLDRGAITPLHESLYNWLAIRDDDNTQIEEQMERFTQMQDEEIEMRQHEFLQAQQQHMENRRSLQYIMSLIELIYLSNTYNRRIPPEAFHLDTLCHASQHKASIEYRHYLNNQRAHNKTFTYIDYPFLMNVNFKQYVLDIESYVQQQNGQYQHMMGGGLMAGDQRHGGGMFNFDPHLTIEIERERIIDDTLDQLVSTNRNLTLPLKVKFKNEQGVDQGGVRKEFFQILINKLFGLAGNIPTDMFVPKNNNSVWWFNAQSFEAPLKFELLGILWGLAIYNNVIINIRLPRVVYKKVLGEPVGLEDIKEVDATLYNSLKHVIEYTDADLERALGITFVAQYEYFGAIQTVPLKQNGDSIPVTLDNKDEYVNAYVQWYLNDSIKQPYSSFEKGFKKVVQKSKFIKHIDSQDLMQILNGSEELDFAEMRKKCLYANGYTKDTPVCVWLWEIIDEFTLDQKKKFLQFCTGSEKAPVQGLGSFEFIIQRNGDDTDKLPSAQTCFNYFLLPQYASKEKLREKLILAINNAEGFGLL